MKRKIILTCILLMLMGGCLSSIDPFTGEKKYRLDPNETAVWEKRGEAAVGIAGILSTFWPALLPFAGYGAHAIKAWKTVKPKLEQAQTEADMYHTSTRSIVLAIDEFKKSNPEDWAKLKDKLEKAVGPEVENIIRALRGLPAKA